MGNWKGTDVPEDSMNEGKNAQPGNLFRSGIKGKTGNLIE
jgi:hypothetical protein